MHIVCTDLYIYMHYVSFIYKARLYNRSYLPLYSGWNGVHLRLSRKVTHVFYQLFDSKMADDNQLWSLQKLKNYLRWSVKSVTRTEPEPEIDGNVPNRKSFIVIFFNFTMFFKNLIIYCVFLYT